MRVSGWGFTETRKLSNDLMTAEVPLRPLTECRRSSTEQDKICAGGLPPKYTDACGGDSGGPLVYEKHGKYFLYGVVASGTPGCGTTGVRFGIYTRVKHYLQWIKEVSGVVPPVDFHIKFSK